MVEDRLKSYKAGLDATARELKSLRKYCKELEDAYRSIDSEASAIVAEYPKFLYPSIEDIVYHPQEANTKNFTKVVEGRIRWNGLTSEQAFWLELSCLNRLWINHDENIGFFPFPKIYRADPQSHTIEMENRGRSLPDLEKAGAVIEITKLKDQLNKIFETLQKAEVVHCDMDGSGKNILIDDFGNISLIDFDIAVINSHPLSEVIKSRFDEFIKRGGYKHQASLIEKILLRSPSIFADINS